MDTKDRIITREYLLQNPNHIFVFGDNLERKGKGGAAILRDLSNTYGFITKKKPSHHVSSYFTTTAYIDVFQEEVKKLKKEIKANPDKTYLISRLGAGLANRFKIHEHVIRDNIKPMLTGLDNVEFLW